MRNGAIVMSTKHNGELFRVKGIINSHEGRKIAILEELCKCSQKANFTYCESLNLLWSPKVLKETVEEYDINGLEENILMSNIMC